MEYPARNFHAVRDRETLIRLDSGLEIIRAMKHEPISYIGLSQGQIERVTSKINGSKFAGDWTLDRYVAWLTSYLDGQDWTFPPSQRKREHIVIPEPIGIAAGKESHTIEVVVRGRYVHAYPVEDL